MNKERKIRITYALFGTKDNAEPNKIPYVFTVKILSSVYDADAKNIEIDENKLNAKFDGKEFDLTPAISAKYAAGINVGKDLQLFDVNTPASEKTVNVYDVDSYKMSGDYVLDTTGKPIEIAKDDLMAFGMSAADYVAVDGSVYLMKSDVKKLKDKDKDEYYTYYKGWETIMAKLLTIYDDNRDGGLKVKDRYKNDKDAIESVATEKALFDKYGKLIAWLTDKVDIPEKIESKADEIKNVTFAFADNDAEKYCSIDRATGVITPKDNISDSDLVNRKATVNVKMTIKDIWGMTMTKTFQVTITKE